MKKFLVITVVLFLFTIAFGISRAIAATTLNEGIININGTIYYALLDPFPEYFDDSAFDWMAGLGTITINYKPGEAGDYYIISFFDHEIDKLINTYFNEYGKTTGTPDARESWEIDEPGFTFGDIYDNLLGGTLDNTNNIPLGSEDDVSMAIGWEFSLAKNEMVALSLTLEETPPSSGFYLSHTDPNSDYSLYFSSSLDIIPYGYNYQINMTTGWSMISIPVKPESLEAANIYPSAEVIYGYQKGSGYFRVTGNEEMEAGKGYWILYKEPQYYTLTGQPIDFYSKSIEEDGWWMIGGCTTEAQATSENCTIEVIYKYSPGIGYQRVPASENLEPGRGYWILFTNVLDQAEFMANKIKQ
ncbi:MAG: hypothetical protein ACMUIU_05405 [bacterium]